MPASECSDGRWALVAAPMSAANAFAQPSVDGYTASES